jgi:hypothetical protein
MNTADALNYTYSFPHLILNIIATSHGFLIAPEFWYVAAVYTDVVMVTVPCADLLGNNTRPRLILYSTQARLQQLHHDVTHGRGSKIHTR